jgi:hypothetical protein
MTAPPGTATGSLLRDDALEEISRIGEADLLVGIPSYNNARTIGHVVRAVAFGLAKYFPDSRAVLVNSDGGSTDGTPQVVGQADLGATRAILIAEPAHQLQRIITAYQGTPGKGSAFRTVFEIARRLGAKACVVVDSDLRSITPEWVQLLLGPVLHEGFDYVAPLYSRHKFDGTITNSIVYPMVRSLYGKRIRQPIGGDFGFSGRLASHYLDFDVWDTDVARYGIDIWMTTTALTGGFQVCQSYLGAKIHDAKDPGADLSAMLTQVTGSLFRQMEQHASFWEGVAGSEPIPEFGFEYTVGLEPIPVNVTRMVEAYDRGVRDFDGIYRSFLTEITRTDLQQLLGQTPASFAMPTDVWVRLVYEYAAAYHHRRLTTDHLLRSLTPLYLGRTAAWVVQAGPLDAPGVEAALDALCGRFEALKPYLLDRWHEGRRHT